ncbi:16123_t:CDS:2 [Funneliformis geosporum]|uniref:16123_t:CDS:1 n=1 Tax=Funneliformis geosporum TaxID=1117311 RepID=A0A9W4SQR8_9GLOM|nr:16123_t:CDS:2 [Funneliformis geosporum]
MEFPSHKKIGMDKFKKDLWNSAKNVAKIIQQDRLVTQAGWITVGRFNRVYGVYQLIPGPEATDLAINYLVTLVSCGLLFNLIDRNYFWAAVAEITGLIIYVVFKGIPSLSSLGLGVDPTPSPGHIFALGLIAGTLSFGGAYQTVIPIIQAEAVTVGHWMTQKTCLDALTIGNILSTPLVMFSTFIGFQAGNTYGGIGYAFLELYYLIAVTPIDLLKSSVTTSTVLINLPDIDKPIAAQHNSIAAVVYMITLAALYSFKTPYLALMLVIFGAIAGSF